MPTKKRIRPGEKLPIKLTGAERTLVLEELTCLDQEIEQVVRDTPSGQPVMMTLDDLDDFGGFVAAEANHCKDKRKTKALDAIFEKIQSLLGEFTDEEPPQTLKTEDARNEKLISDQAVQIAQFAAQALVAAGQLGIKKKMLEHFSLAPAQREVLSLLPSMTKALKQKLTQDGSTFSVGDVASMSVVCFTAYGLDKWRAVNGSRRVSENTLQSLALLGGWPGALLGQWQFRHKTKKMSFLIVFWLVAALHVAIIGTATYVFFR